MTDTSLLDGVDTSTPIGSCLSAWHQLFLGQSDALDHVLADDVVLHSPVLFRPIVGKEIVSLYLTGAYMTFVAGATTDEAPAATGGDTWDGSFRYVRVVTGERDAVLEFETTMAGKYVNGTLTDFLPTPVYLPSTSWRRFRIDCYGTVIQYLVDGEVLALTSDSSHPRGFFGVGYHSFFATSSKVRGTRADNLSAFVDTSTLPPVAQFAAEPTSGMWPLEVQFTDTSAGGPAESWVWDFGDDQTSTDRHPLHTYALPGLYTVSLTVTGPNGADVETKTNYVDVLAWPGDFDKDRDVDLDDFAHIQACLSGNGVIQGDTACAAANFDGDTDVDLLDMAKFRGCLSGANTPSDRDCLGDD